MSTAVGKDVRVRYDLTGLGELEFEDLTQALALRVLGPGVQVFGDGPDGGREATFEGRLRYPDPDPRGPWDGYGVLQAKFKHQPLGANPDAAWLRGRSVHQGVGPRRWISLSRPSGCPAPPTPTPGEQPSATDTFLTQSRETDGQRR